MKKVPFLHNWSRFPIRLKSQRYLDYEKAECFFLYGMCRWVWDRSCDIYHFMIFQMEKLNRRTQMAIVELIKERIEREAAEESSEEESDESSEED